MPIFNHPEKGRILFIHIPKTAGSSVEVWLQKKGFTLDKLNHWSGHTAQHAIKSVYDTWGEFDYKFTVVREPLSRFASALAYKGVNPGNANPAANRAIKHLEQGASALHGQFGNHLVPQVEFLGDDVEIFKYEDDFVSEISLALDLPSQGFPRSNVSKSVLKPHHFSADVQQRLIEIYSADYERLDYSPEIHGA